MVNETSGGSVGLGGVNRAGDVRMVQRLLNDLLASAGSPLLAVDAVAGPKTIAAIEWAQRRFGVPADGRVDPGGPTMGRLVQQHLQSLTAGVEWPEMAPRDPRTSTSDHVSAALAEYLVRLRG